MRRFIISFLILLGILAAGTYFIAIPKIKSSLIQVLEEAHFTNIEIKKFSLSKTGFTIERIKADNFEARNVNVTVYLPTLFIKKSIDSLTLSQLIISYPHTEKRDALSLRIKKGLQNLTNKPLPPTEIRNLKIILSPTLILTGTLKSEKNQNISATLNANNEFLSLDSQWLVSRETEKNIIIHANFEKLSLKNKYISLNRATGWLSYNTQDDYSINGQLEAGSGTLFNAPLNNITLVSGPDKKRNSLLLRTHASGFPDISLAGDMEWHDNFKIDRLVINLAFPSSKELEEYLEVNSLKDKENLFKGVNLKDTETIFKYLPERRFVDGPYPFEIKIQEKDNKKMSGTILIYPKSLDVRGTLEGNNNILRFFNETLPFENQMTSDRTVRLEGSLLK